MDLDEEAASDCNADNVDDEELCDEGVETGSKRKRNSSKVRKQGRLLRADWLQSGCPPSSLTGKCSSGDSMKSSLCWTVAKLCFVLDCLVQAVARKRPAVASSAAATPAPATGAGAGKDAGRGAPSSAGHTPMDRFGFAAGKATPPQVTLPAQCTCLHLVCCQQLASRAASSVCHNVCSCASNLRCEPLALLTCGMRLHP